ncbi:MAG: Uma2 family endonuclease [Microscillaceae bacterium]|jgi:Uma2 family endonuclease|nr:Uma2 family endonuclease [Microscillaceae bacterium]
MKLIEQILEMPDAYLVVQKIQAILHQEHQKRQNFYELIDENQKMEFINGEIVYHSPVMKRHNEACSYLFSLLMNYTNKYNLGFVGIEKILISLTRNDYEPDVCYFNPSKAQYFKPEQARFPAPDWIIEIISPSTESVDRGIKFQDYAAHEVQEYWLIDPDNQTVEQYFLKNQNYELLLKAKSGTIESQTLSGFEIPIKAIFDKDTNLQILQDLLGK